MKYYLVSGSCDSGPYTVTELNELLAQGKIDPSLLCQRHGSDEVKRLDEELRYVRGPDSLGDPKKRVSVWFLLLLAAATVWIWISYVRFRPPDLKDYDSVHGTLVSADQVSMGRNSNRLDFRLQGNSVRYSIDTSLYEGIDTNRLIANARNGSAVTVLALRSEITSPRTAPLATEPTVWVCGLEIDHQVYLAFDSYLQHELMEHRFHLGFAMTTPLILGWCVSVYRKQRIQITSGRFIPWF